jgi:hypothetical protein
MNLIDMIDGVGSLKLNVPVRNDKGNYKLQQDVVIKRRINKYGPTTKEIVVGRILAFGDNNTATVSIQRPGGMTTRSVVSLKEVSPVTEVFRRNSVQFRPGFRGSV